MTEAKQLTKLLPAGMLALVLSACGHSAPGDRAATPQADATALSGGLKAVNAQIASRDCANLQGKSLPSLYYGIANLSGVSESVRRSLVDSANRLSRVASLQCRPLVAQSPPAPQGPQSTVEEKVLLTRSYSATKAAPSHALRAPDRKPRPGASATPTAPPAASPTRAANSPPPSGSQADDDTQAQTPPIPVLGVTLSDSTQASASASTDNAGSAADRGHRGDRADDSPPPGSDGPSQPRPQSDPSNSPNARVPAKGDHTNHADGSDPGAQGGPQAQSLPADPSAQGGPNRVDTDGKNDVGTPQAGLDGK